MKAQATNVRHQFSADMQQEIIVTLKGRHEIQDLKDAIAKGKTLDVEIKPRRERRSLDANAYFWVLLDKLAKALRTSRDDLYLIMLERYGHVYDYVLVIPEAVDRLRKEFRTVKEIGKGKIGNTDAIQLQVFYGSSTYDSRQMARLIDGVVSECKEQGIETMTPAELALIKERWNNDV